MSEQALVRGFACPFNQASCITHENNLIEILDASCFDAFLAEGKMVAVQTAHQGGRKLATTTELFSCAFGLAFSFELDTQDPYLREIVQGRSSGCSVFMTNRKTKTEIVFDVEHERVISAGLDHIALSDCPAYPTTRVWRADAAANLEAAPFAVRDLDEKWEAAYLVHHELLTFLPREPEPDMSDLSPMFARLLHSPMAATNKSRARIGNVLKGLGYGNRNRKI